MNLNPEIHFEPETPGPNVDSPYSRFRQRAKGPRPLIDQRKIGAVPHLLYFQNHKLWCLTAAVILNNALFWTFNSPIVFLSPFGTSHFWGVSPLNGKNRKIHRKSVKFEPQFVLTSAICKALNDLDNFIFRTKSFQITTKFPSAKTLFPREMGHPVQMALSLANLCFSPSLCWRHYSMRH